jgi:hypothetical protein
MQPIAAAPRTPRGAIADLCCGAEVVRHDARPCLRSDSCLCTRIDPMHAYRRTAKASPRGVKQLRSAGAQKVWSETASGAKTERAQLRRALDQLERGDVLMVTRLDRLARSTRDLLNIIATIADKRAGFRSLGDTWADTTTAHGDRHGGTCFDSGLAQVPEPPDPGGSSPAGKDMIMSSHTVFEATRARRAS